MKTKIFLLFFIGISSVLLAQNSDYKLYTISDGLPENSINNIVQDNIGYLYFGTKKSGIVRFDGKEFTVFNEKNGLISNRINDIYYKNDSLVIATDKGISVRINNQFLNYKNEEIHKVFNVNNQLYFATKKGLSVLLNNKISPVRLSTEIDSQKINDIVFDGNHFWIATNKNLFKIDDLKNTKTSEKIADGNFTSLLNHNNKLIVSELSKGLFLISNNKLIKKINANPSITGIKKIDNQLWITLKNNGFELLNASDFSFIKRINKYNSLQTNIVNSAFKDNQNTTWLSTNIGFYRMNSSQQKKIKKPIIVFENIDVVYQTLDSVNINSYNKTLLLKPNQNHISFSFKSVDLKQPNSVLYRYKLNDRFSPWSKNSSVNFANLEAGQYDFFVQSKIGDRKSELKFFSFEIDTPFYKKTITQIIALVVLFTIILLISLFNIYRIKRKNKAKIEKLKLENHLISLEQKAMQLQMNPHFIFNVLNGIKAHGISGNKAELSNTISKFATLLRGILNNSKQEEISLKNEIGTLKNYIELEQQISPFEFNYIIEKSLKNEDVEEILIPPMLVQPFVENAIQHAFNPQIKDNLITISFENKNGFLHCSVQDNGIGIFKNQQQKSKSNHKSLAIEITKERIKNSTKYNTFSIEEIKENNSISGTKVSFKIPLKTDY